MFLSLVSFEVHMKRKEFTSDEQRWQQQSDQSLQYLPIKYFLKNTTRRNGNHQDGGGLIHFRNLISDGLVYFSDHDNVLMWTSRFQHYYGGLVIKFAIKSFRRNRCTWCISCFLHKMCISSIPLQFFCHITFF